MVRFESVKASTGDHMETVDDANCNNPFSFSRAAV
ncbi:hypothetical protein BVRB_4g095280 [Beta vulgaris subsp. vulgaris]|uniref:Uncharacterized protein n=1 Tax=Beta vulgaris subsp. vulgaris TaxID=3555 RepID=A0A0J8BB82_BETVV|nr:hypothetical protein BVRB_4g095280 [Beta vulgaris subsp. vulgaris]